MQHFLGKFLAVLLVIICTGILLTGTMVIADRGLSELLRVYDDETTIFSMIIAVSAWNLFYLYKTDFGKSAIKIARKELELLKLKLEIIKQKNA